MTSSDDDDEPNKVGVIVNYSQSPPNTAPLDVSWTDPGEDAWGEHPLKYLFFNVIFHKYSQYFMFTW